MKPARPERSGAAIRQTASDWVARRDAGLSADGANEFHAWCEADPRHAEAVARFERLWAHLDRPRHAGAGAQLHRDLALLERRKRRQQVRVAGVAAAVILVVFSAWWVGRWSTQTLKSPASSIAITQPERRVLVDGTVVEYPRSTELAVDFSSPLLRRVTLRKGQAHFEVASNPARPFVVNAVGVDFRAVGTAFSVQVGTAAVELLVTEGRVAVEAASPVATASPAVEEPVSSAPALVSAGHRLSVAIAVQSRQVALVPEPCSAAEIERRLAWRSPRMEFSDVPLRDVVAAINAFVAERGGARFALADPALGATRMSGIFRVGDAQAFIGILESGFGISAERREGQSIVLRKGP